MGTTCSSDCKLYQGSINKIAIIEGVNYTNCGVLNPNILPIRISMFPNPSRFEVRLGSVDNIITFTVFSDDNHTLKSISNTNAGIIVENAPFENYLRIKVTLLAGSNLSATSYVVNDYYFITLYATDCSIPTRGLPTAQARFYRPGADAISSDLGPTSGLERIISPNIIPRINLEAQTTITGSDIGDAVFNIYDEFTYYNKKEIPDNTCKDRQTSDIKQTIFRECCPYMVSVVRGEGSTLWEKLQYLFENEDTGLPNVYIFYENIALYGMAKYILSRLLYGKFDINYLLGKYNEKFLKKLSTSRFCSFTTFFEENNYNKYFLFE